MYPEAPHRETINPDACLLYTSTTLSSNAFELERELSKSSLKSLSSASIGVLMSEMLSINYTIFHGKSTKKYGIQRFIITFVLKLCN